MSNSPTDDLFEWSLTEALFSTPATIFLTAWAGHIPFLFALIKLVRPRTYVELGVHFGGSFVGACSAAKRYKTDTLCFGIDNWQGDQHAGSYEGNEIFRHLSSYLKSYFPTATLYRQSFSEALSRFDDGAIDVLHFDGLHTFDAIQQDFDAWSPKLSQQGIALFHDISVREGEFGVWKYWERIKLSYPTMEFYHSAGLGVAFIGPDQPPHARRLLELWRSNESFREFFRTTCEHLGRLLPERMDPSSTETLKLLTQQCRTWKLLWPITRFSKAFQLANSVGKKML
jgi:Methyltransferase domain